MTFVPRRMLMSRKLEAVRAIGSSSDGGRATFDGADRNGVDIEFDTQPGAGDRHRGRNIRNGLDRISPVGQQITSGAIRAQ